MKGKQNIEDAFRSEFEGFTQTPSNKVWNGINKKMIGPRFESMYKNAFNGFKVAPSEQTWRRIAAAVWFNKFIHFSPFSFNIYYAGLILTAVVGTVITVNNNPNLDFVNFSEENYKAKTNEINEIEDDNPEENIFEYRNAIPDFFALNSDNEIETNNLINEVQTIDNTTNQNDIVYNSNIADNNNNITANANITNQTNENNTEENNTNNTENGLLAETNSFNSQTQNNLYFKLDRLVNENSFTLSYKPTTFDIADKVISGIPEQDVITYDTIGVDYHGDPILKEKSYFAIGLYVAPFYHDYNTQLLNSELAANYDIYNSNISPELSYSTGINIKYSYRQFHIETGISYLSLHESFSSSISSYETNTTSHYDYFDQEVWDPYTILILDLDEYLQGNIVYIEHTDSILSIVPDSTLVTITDSTLVTNDHNATSNYHILDIPLIAGYEFQFGKTSISPKAGIISSVLISREGTYYDMSMNDVMSCEHSKNTKLLFDYYASINLQYNITDHTSVYIEPHIRADINSMYDKSYVLDQKSRKYGLKTGIYYKF